MVVKAMSDEMIKSRLWFAEGYSKCQGSQTTRDSAEVEFFQMGHLEECFPFDICDISALSTTKEPKTSCS